MESLENRRLIVDTLIYGDIIIEQTDNRVSARHESEDSVVVTIERSGPRKRKHIPIGTRDAAFLSARVNDRPLELTLGRAWLGMRSYRITIENDGRYLSLRPRDMESSVFQNGKPDETEKEFAELTTRADGDVEVSWATPGTVKVFNKKIEFEPPIPTTEDLLIGYASAAAFGTGGLSLFGFLGNLLEAIPIPL